MIVNRNLSLTVLIVPAWTALERMQQFLLPSFRCLFLVGLYWASRRVGSRGT